MNYGVGEVAALSTAGMWAFSAMLFSRATRRIGSFNATQIRIPFALLLLCLLSYFTRGEFFPLGVSSHGWTYLTLSGFIGLTLGDITLFRSYLYLGPRQTSLVMSTAPIWAALFSFLILGETLSVRSVTGIAITLAGVAWALSSRTRTQAHLIDKKGVGIALALTGAFGQAAGLVLAKKGIADISAIAATQIRLVSALIGGLVIITATRSWPSILRATRDRDGMKFTMVGTVVGPVVGVTLSLVAVKHTDVGIAACLMATAPIMIIPLAVKFDGERIGLSGLLGTLVAFVGVAILVL